MKIRDKILAVVNHSESDLFVHSLFCDGISEISSRIVAVDPSKAEHFMFKTIKEYEYDSSLSIPLSSYDSEMLVIGDVVSVHRKEATSFAKSCDKIAYTKFESSQDVESLNYRSEINPAYVIKNIGGTTTEVLVAPVPGLNSSTTVEVCQIVYNIPVEWRTSSVFEQLDNPLDIEEGIFKIRFTNAEEDAYIFPVRYQHILYIYVMLQLLNAIIVKGGNEEEDEELVDTLKNAKEDFQTQYDEFFKIFLNPGTQKGGSKEDES